MVGWLFSVVFASFLASRTVHLLPESCVLNTHTIIQHSMPGSFLHGVLILSWARTRGLKQPLLMTLILVSGNGLIRATLSLAPIGVKAMLNSGWDNGEGEIVIHPAISTRWNRSVS